MDARLVVLLVLFVFLVGCEGKVVSEESVWLQTKDNFRIRSTLWYSRGDKAVILVHMIDRDRHDWDFFAKKLNVFRISAAGMDLRGHGESAGDWSSFSDKDFLNMVNDIGAVKDKLDSEGKKVVGIVGASIGADLALKYAVKDKDIKCLVLLSPGIAYKSINIEEDMSVFDRPVFIAASSEDSYAYESSKIMYDNLKGKKELFIEENLGHGTDMLPKSVELQDRIFGFLNENLE